MSLLVAPTDHLSCPFLTDRLLEDDQFLYTYDANGNLTDKTDPTHQTHYTY